MAWLGTSWQMGQSLRSASRLHISLAQPIQNELCPQGTRAALTSPPHNRQSRGVCCFGRGGEALRLPVTGDILPWLLVGEEELKAASILWKAAASGSLLVRLVRGCGPSSPGGRMRELVTLILWDLCTPYEASLHMAEGSKMLPPLVPIPSSTSYSGLRLNPPGA